MTRSSGSPSTRTPRCRACTSAGACSSGSLRSRHHARWFVRGFFALHPAVMAIAVTATGNHYFLDSLAGALVALLALGLLQVVPATRSSLCRGGLEPAGDERRDSALRSRGSRAAGRRSTRGWLRERAPEQASIQPRASERRSRSSPSRPRSGPQASPPEEQRARSWESSSPDRTRPQECRSGCSSSAPRQPLQ